MNAFSLQDEHEPIVSRVRMELIGSPGYPHTRGPHVSARLSASSPTETGYWSSVKGTVTKDRQQL